MKKITAILLTISLALSLCGCSKTSENSISDSKPVAESSTIENKPDAESSTIENKPDAESSATENKPDADNSTSENERIPSRDHDLRMIYSGECGIMDNHDRTECITESGYYSIKHLNEDSYFENLTYIDFATKTEIPLCSDSSCKHDNESCTSCFSNILSDCLFVNGDYLYLLSSDIDQDQYISNSDNGAWSGGLEPLEIYASIFRMNLDGTDRQKIWEADNLGDVIEGNVFADGDDILFIAKTPTAEKTSGGMYFMHSKNRAVMRYSPAENKITERIPLDDHNGLPLRTIGCTESKILLETVVYPNGKGIFGNLDVLGTEHYFGGELSSEELELQKKAVRVYFTLDLSTKEITEVLRINISNGESYIFSGNYAYYAEFNDQSYTIKKLDLFSGETTEIAHPDGYGFQGIFEDKMMFVKSGDDAFTACTYFTDLDGKDLTKSNYNIHTNVNSQYFGEFVVLGITDDTVLVKYDHVMIPDELFPDQYSGETWAYGSISLEELYSGGTDIEKITML